MVVLGRQVEPQVLVVLTLLVVFLQLVVTVAAAQVVAVPLEQTQVAAQTVAVVAVEPTAAVGVQQRVVVLAEVV